MVFDEIGADVLLTREQVADALTRCGVPYSAKTLSTRACRGGRTLTLPALRQASDLSVG